MADFIPAYLNTLVWESGYNIIPGDDGGETYMGISFKFNPSFPGRAIIDNYKKKYANGRIPAGTRFKDDTTLELMVRDYYMVNYWNAKARGGEIINQKVANLVYDMVVNHGRGARIVNTAIINFGGKVEMVKKNVNGRISSTPINKITNDTLHWLNSNPISIYPLIWLARSDYYHADDDFDKFKNGWMNRLNSFPKTIT